MLSTEHRACLLLLMVDQWGKAFDGNHIVSAKRRVFSKYEIVDIRNNRLRSCGGWNERNEGLTRS